MYIEFKLSMPNIGSWNGKWTGQSNYYAVIKQFNVSQKDVFLRIIKKGYYHYNFGDGWSAGVHCRSVDAKEKSKIKRMSNGFCGYEWMVKSIINNDEIIVGDNYGNF